MKQIAKFLAEQLGYSIVSYPRSPVSRSRAIGGHTRFLRDLFLRGFTPATILDVGAHKGFWTRLAKQQFPDALIFMIEPQQMLLPHLRETANLYKGINYAISAAGARKGDITLSVPSASDSATIFPIPGTTLDDTDTKHSMVRIDLIDNLIREAGLDLPDLIKLDVQGAEIDALQGAASLFGHTEVFICEASLHTDNTAWPDFGELVKYMLDRDYVVYDFLSFLPRPADNSLGQLDVAFVRRNGFFRQIKNWAN